MCYCYYNIQSDRHFSKKIKRESLIAFLQTIAELQQQSHQTFKNKSDFQWLEMILVQTKDGNYALSEGPNGWVTLIAVVCNENANQNAYIEVFRKIADYLGWQVYQEDNDGENRLIT